MNCRSCGTLLPQGIAYCPTCKQPVFYGREDYKGQSFPLPPGSGQQANPHRGNPQEPTLQAGKAGPDPFGSYLSSPQTPNNAEGWRPNTESLSPTTFGQPGQQFSPITDGQPWPAPFNQTSGQQSPNGFPPAQTYSSGPRVPQTPFANPAPPNQSGNTQQPMINEGAGRNFFAGQAAPNNLPPNMPTNPETASRSFSGQPPSGSFPRPSAPANSERSRGLLSSSGSFPASNAQPANPETASRFLYGPSASGNFSPANAMPPASWGANAPMFTNGAPSANFTNTSEPLPKTTNGRLGPAMMAPKQRSKGPAVLLGMICLVVVLVGAGIFAVVSFANKGADLATDSVTVPASMTNAGAAPVIGPSGQKVTMLASSVIISAQSASAINNNYIPTQTTTSFATNQTIYVSLVINSKNQPGYIMVKWYKNKQLLGSDNLTHDPKNTIAFFTQKYANPTTGNAELYWCTKADCSDAQLARVVNFTVGS